MKLNLKNKSELEILVIDESLKLLENLILSNFYSLDENRREIYFENRLNQELFYIKLIDFLHMNNTS